MADPTDPQTAALANIQNAGRTYNRGRRRGAQANTDPAFLAAVETTDPAARREALAQYARGSASELFPGQAGSAPPNGRDVVNQAFPQGDAFAPVQAAAAPLPTQADVMSQVAPRRAVQINRQPDSARMEAAEAKMGEEGDTMFQNLQYAGPDAVAMYQDSTGMPGAEDSPEAHQWRMERGRKIMQSTPDPRAPGLPAQATVEDGYDEAAFDAAQTAEPAPVPSGIESIGAAADNIRRMIQARRGR